MTMTLVKLSYNSKLVPDPGLVLQTPLCRVRCTNAVRITISSTKNLHVDLRDNNGTPYLMTSGTSTDPLESDFNVIKGTQCGRVILKKHLYCQDIKFFLL